MALCSHYVTTSENRINKQQNNYEKTHHYPFACRHVCRCLYAARDGRGGEGIWEESGEAVSEKCIFAALFACFGV